MRIVIVGATGNIGTALLRRLRDRAHEVVGIARRVPDAPRPPYSAAEWHALDVSRDDSGPALRDRLREADVVVHLAWKLQPNRDEKVLWDTNVAGTDRVLRAAGEAGVSHVVVVSSVGAYSPGPKRSRVGEDWPTGGIPSAHYSRHKAMTERLLDGFEASHPGTVLARVRPGLVMHDAAGAEVRRLFLGPGLPVRWLRPRRLPVLPFPSRVVSQVIHADDLADLLVRVIERRAGGAFNAAAEPVLDADAVAQAFRTRALPIRTAVVRALVAAAWRLRLVAMDPGWVDIASTVPVMSTQRARAELGWAPTIDARDALAELVEALAVDERHEGSPPLDP